MCASPVQNLDLPTTIDFIFELCHPSDTNLNFKREGSQDFGEKYYYDHEFGYPECFPIKDVVEKGFIYPDKSLRIKFYVKKQNYRQLL